MRSVIPWRRRRTRVLRRLQGITERIYLHVMGEPLLHPELPTILALAGEAGYQDVYKRQRSC